MKKLISLVLCACLLALSAGAALGEVHTVATPEPRIPSLQDFATTTLEGEEVTQALWAQADLTLVNVWATYCSPCLAEMPDLGALAAEYADTGVQFVGIVMDVVDQQLQIDEAQVELAREIVEKTGAGYTHLLPSLDLIYAALLEISAVPTTFFLDKDGNRVGETYMGMKSGDDWKQIVEDTKALVAQ